MARTQSCARLLLQKMCITLKVAQEGRCEDLQVSFKAVLGVVSDCDGLAVAFFEWIPITCNSENRVCGRVRSRLLNREEENCVFFAFFDSGKKKIWFFPPAVFQLFCWEIFSVWKNSTF